MNALVGKKIQFIDLEAQQNLIREKINERINGVLDHGKYIMGPEAQELEEVLANYVGAKCVSCASGTDALLMALMAYDVGPGDAIFTTPFTFIATAEVISLLGATPVFVDIEPATFNVDAAKLREAVATTQEDNKLKVRGIIAVDLFGQPVDYDEIGKVAKEFELFVLEDAASLLGRLIMAKKRAVLVTWEQLLFSTKAIGLLRRRGAVFTDSEKLAKKLCSIRVHGKGEQKYDYVRIGIKGRLDTLQAAIFLKNKQFLAKKSSYEMRLQKDILQAFGVP